MKKSVLSVLLAAVFAVTALFAALPAGAEPGRDVVYGTCGPNLSWLHSTTSGYLRIYGTGEMTDYEGHSSDFHPYRSFITTVDIWDGVTSIGNRAFFECERITSAAIPYSMTRIGSFAFSGCIALPEIELPAGVTEIGDNAFENCPSLSSVTFNGEPPTVFGENVFINCSPDLRIYYSPAFASSWAPNGETEWHGWPIRPIGWTFDPGDIDADGEITISDALLSLRAAIGALELSQEQFDAADVDVDGEITVGDALIILRRAMNIAA